MRTPDAAGPMAGPSPDEAEGPPPPRRRLASTRTILAMAAGFGLVGGYLDLLMIVLKKDVFHASMYYHQGRHFAWAIPLGALAISMALGVTAAAIDRVRPGLVSPRAAAWLFATLALWGPLLRAPLAGTASLVLAAGLGRWISRLAAAGRPRLRRVATAGLAGLAGLLGVSATVSLAGRSLAESRAVARLPAPPSGARNVLLVVLDTVRAESLSLYGYGRETTPHLARWAKRGVRFDRALAPAPWTLPSHGSFFTGRWPYELNLHWQTALDDATPTLAGFLGSKGYETAGFAANTNFCSYESGLGRGFAHYEDYPLTPSSILASTVAGRWLVQQALPAGDFYGRKWALLQSRGAVAINRAFLDWLSRRGGGGRPFFAFLNYFDAHEPFVLPEGAGPHFGLKPESPRDSRMLMDYWDLDKLELEARDVALARDAYDDCIAYLDRQVGALLDELERRGVLRDTLVIVTSDHGEEFGEHGVFNHGYSLYMPEIHVPLLIVSPPGAPAGLAVTEPVSLRDLPATVVDLLGLSAGSPFPGRSLGAHWRSEPESGGPPATPALSEVFVTPVLHPRRGRGPAPRGFAMSLVAGDQHYVRDSMGAEALYDLAGDPRESHDIKGSADGLAALGRFRGAILRVLTEAPPTRGLARLYLKQYVTALGSLVGGQARSAGSGPVPTRPSAGAGEN